MNQVIKAAYNYCKPDESLLVGDARYIPFSERGLRGTDGDLVEELFNTVTIAESASHLLVSGFRGSGKTTELRRLEKRLQDQGYWVVFVDSEDYLNLTVPATVSDLWISIAAGFDRFLDKNAAAHMGIRRFWERIETFLNREVVSSDLRMTVGVGVGEAEWQIALKDNPDFKQRLNEVLEPKRPKLVKECRDFVEEAVALLKRKQSSSAGTVVIVDSFEKLQGTTRNADEVRDSAETLFVRDWNQLQTPCHAIYTVPPWMAFIEAGANSDLGRTYLLSMCKVSRKEGGDCEEGIQALLEFLGRRMDLPDIFGSPDAVVPLVKASGGYPRDLLRLIQEVLKRNGRAEVLPLPADKVQDDVNRAIALHVEQYEDALDGEDVPLLLQIAREHGVQGWSKQDKLRIATLFDHHFVLCYRNGKRWLDLHPMIQRSDTIQAAAQKAEREAARKPAEAEARASQ